MRLTSLTGEAGDPSSSSSMFLLLILLALSGSSFVIASLERDQVDHSDSFSCVSRKMCNTNMQICYRFPPMSPVFSLINCKVWNVHIVSLPGALVIGQVPPFDQVVVVPLLVHTEWKTTYTTVNYLCS